jgi:hypothetical protein
VAARPLLTDELGATPLHNNQRHSAVQNDEATSSAHDDALTCPRCRYPATRLVPPAGLCTRCAYPAGGAPEDDTEETA